MLLFQPTHGERSDYPTLRASYLALRDVEPFGRVDCRDPQDGAGGGLVSIGDARFECRIQITGRGRWTYVPADWVMYDAGEPIQSARSDGGRTYLVEEAGDDPPLRLILEGLGGCFAIALATDSARVGDMTWTKRTLVPKPKAPQMILRTPQMSERRAMFLAWVGLQHWLRLTRA